MRMTLIAGALVVAALAAPVPASAAPGWAVIDPLATQVGCLDDMVVAPDGTVTAVWTGGAAGTTALAATRPPGGTFSSPATLSTAPVSLCSAKLAVSRSGALVAVWLQRATGASW